MAFDDGIREPYRVSGITRAGSGYLFARLRIRRKAVRQEVGQQEPETEALQEESSPPDGKKRIDIKA
ncbi:MAG TPA: hypothetical protein VLH56_08110 [Dissulfurispiraceae bacterium]|nr:hypothetical protein [Dissulfurispiraceae bacterium]